MIRRIQQVSLTVFALFVGSFIFVNGFTFRTDKINWQETICLMTVWGFVCYILTYLCKFVKSIKLRLLVYVGFICLNITIDLLWNSFTSISWISLSLFPAVFAVYLETYNHDN